MGTARARAFSSFEPGSTPATTEWTHDFGSILAFTENNFPVQGQGPGLGPIAPSGYYADVNSLDQYDANNPDDPYVPLWEFFLGYPNNPRAFTNINPQNPAYNAAYFQNYYKNGTNGNTGPIGPDEGADDGN